MCSERSASPRQRPRRIRKIPVVIMALALALGVATAILSFVDVGGAAILKMARETLKERTGMGLSAAGVKGNPIRGYTFEDVLLTSEKGDRILSAQSLSGRIDFLALFRGSPRLSVLSVGGVATDLDQFIAEIQRIELPESSGDSDIPINRISLRSSRFTSKWGTVDVEEVGANIRGTNVDVDSAGAVNGVSVRGTAALDIQGSSLSIGKADIAFGKGRITATGEIRPVSQTDSTTTLDLQGSVRGLDLKELAALWPAYLKDADYDGTANLDLEAKGTSATLEISGTVDYRGMKLAGYPVERLGAQLRYSDQRLTVGDVHAVVLSVPIDGELAVASRPGQHPSVMISLEGRDAPLDEIGRTFPSLEGVKGKVSAFTAKIQGPTNALNGAVSLSAPRIAFMGKEVSNLALQLKIAKSDTAAVSGKFLFEGAQGYLQGTAASILSGPRLNLTAKLVGLDVKGISDLIPDSGKYGMAGKIDASVGIKGSPSSPVLSGTLQSPSFTVQGNTLVNPSVTFSYAKDVLTLQKSGGTLNGMPIQLSGTVGPLTSKTPAIDVKAQLTVRPEALGAYVPGIAGYGLKGEIRAGAKISGRLPTPEIGLVASSPALSALGKLSVKNLEVSTLPGSDLMKGEKFGLSIKADSAAADGVGLSALEASLKKEGTKVSLFSFSARSGSGTLSGSGSATLGGKSPALDFSFDLDRLDLAQLAAASGVGLKGTLSGKVGLGGTADSPEFSFKGQSPSVTANGALLSDVAADLSGSPQALKVNNFSAKVGGAPLSASGTLRLTPSMRADLAIRGDGLDLEALTEGFPDLKGQIKGKANLVFDLSGTDKGNTGTGSLSASSAVAFGLRLANVKLPLSLDGNAFKSSNGTLELYGGKASNNLTLDLNTLKFSDSLTASGVDVNALAQDATGGLGGKVTGQGSLSLKITGSAGKTPSYSGTGLFTMGAGGISGFKGLDIVTRLYGLDAIRYTEVTAPLEIRTGRLVLKKGAAAKAPDGDPIYRYARLAEDGTIKFDKSLYLLAEGNVNFQLVNALTGGALGGAGALLQGGVKQLTTGAGLEGILKGALQGGHQGGASADFRDVTVKITGKADSPSVSLVKVGPSSRTNQDGAVPGSDAAPADSSQEQKGDSTVDRIIDAIAPQKPTAPQEQQEGAPEETASQDQGPVQPSTPSIEDQLKEQIGDELKKGLEGLFK